MNNKTKFNKGDKVILITNKYGSRQYNPYFKDFPLVYGIITNLHESVEGKIVVDWYFPNYETFRNYYTEEDLELLNNLDNNEFIEYCNNIIDIKNIKGD